MANRGQSRYARDRAFGPASSTRRRTDWGLNPFACAAMLHQAQAAYCVAGDWPEAGAMGLRFALADYIQTGNEVDAARLTRQLVRHLRANGRIPHESLYPNPDGEHLAANGKPIDGYPLQQA